MAYTAAQLATLQAALASGTLRVQFEDRRIEYRSMKELREAIQIVEDSLAGDLGVARNSRSFARFSKG